MAAIRLMETKDLHTVAELEQECFTVPWSMTLLSDCLDSPLDKVWVLEEGGKIAGYCNFRVISLEVRASNAAAISLYKSYGFKIEAVRKRYYSNPVEDALIMWRRGVEIITT